MIYTPSLKDLAAAKMTPIEIYCIGGEYHNSFIVKNIAKKRPCCLCKKIFHSKSAGNRICPICKSKKTHGTYESSLNKEL